MTPIDIEHHPDAKRLRELGVTGWPVWTREASEFPWFYEEREICYFLQGEAAVTTEDGRTVTMGKGDLVIFPPGMACTWKIRQAVRKHYRLG